MWPPASLIPWIASAARWFSGQSNLDTPTLANRQLGEDSETASVMGNQRRAYVCAVSAVFLWSTVATAFKISLQHLTIPQLLVFSSLASAGTLTAIALIQGTISQLCGDFWDLPVRCQ